MKQRRRLPVAERFWYYVNKEQQCWLWTGTNSGRKWPYGSIREYVEGKWKFTKAHRVSWELHYGQIPEGSWVLHKCDNTLCVRPDHLFLGSPKDNTTDMIQKGRGKFGGGKGSKQNRKKQLVSNSCLECGKVRMVYPSEAGKYCSRKCYYLNNVGKIAGIKLSPESLASFRLKRGWT